METNERNIISRYSHFFITSRGKFLAYSSKSNSFLEISEELYSILHKLSQNENRAVNGELPYQVTEMLIDQGFICKNQDDEDFVSKSQFITQSIQHNRSVLSLILVPTISCNFNCSYCFEPNKKASFMSDDTIDNLINFMKKQKSSEAIEITWYGGEPLLAAKKIQKILEKITELGTLKIKKHTIITNGYFFNKDVIEMFKKYPLNTIQITFDGVRERHNRIRALKNGSKISTYDKIMENIGYISDSLTETALHVRVNIDKDNKDDYYKVSDEIRKRFKSDKIIVYPGMIRLENESKTHCIEPSFDKWEISEFMLNTLKDGYIEGSSYPTLNCCKTCTATCVNSFIIGPKGEIYKCWNDVSDETKILGNISDDLMTNPSLYYRYHQSCMWYNDEECKKCFYMPICNGKCAWYNIRNLFHSGEFNLCQCMQKAPGMLNKTLEMYYEDKLKKKISTKEEMAV